MPGMDISDLPPHLAAAVEAFAARYPQHATQVGAIERCREASGKFCNVALEFGAKSVIVDEVAVVDGMAHKAALVEDIFFDWTGRQFVPDAPWPMIFRERDPWPLDRHFLDDEQLAIYDRFNP
jgi:hypothetical protein